MSDWHGYKVGNRTVYIGPLAGRKSVCLYTEQANVGIKILAFFRNELDAREALGIIDELVER